MDFAFSKEEEEYQRQVRRFMEATLTPERRRRGRDLRDQQWSDRDLEREFKRELSEAGLTGYSLPAEHGGRGIPGAYNAILSYEAAYARAPGVYHSVYIIGPSLSAFGSEEQRRFFLPKIARGEVEFMLGYSEPGAGSDLAGVETRAVADGDEYVINGQKSFSTHAQRTEYAWMIARTNPDVPRHRGLSLFVIPMTTEGITVRPIPTVAGWDHAEVFFENVRVPKTALVGEQDRGWYHLMTAIDFERSGFLYYGEAQRLFDELLDFCRSTRRNGAPLTKDPVVRRQLARMRTEIDAGLRLMKRIVWLQQSGQAPNTEASINKVWADMGDDPAHRVAPAVGAGAQHRGQHQQGVGHGDDPAHLPRGDADHGPLRLAATDEPAPARPRPARLRPPRDDPQPRLHRRERGAAQHHRAARPRHAAGVGLGCRGDAGRRLRRLPDSHQVGQAEDDECDDNGPR